jgi:hypothetical protein
MKESKGEIHQLLEFIGRTNWGIKNVNHLSLIMLFIPGLQGGAVKANKVKKYLQHLQEAKLASYLLGLGRLKKKGCPLDPRIIQTPFALGNNFLKRDAHGAAILRKEKWNYFYFLRPYLLDLQVNASRWEGPRPKISYEALDNGVMFSFLSSSVSF